MSAFHQNLSTVQATWNDKTEISSQLVVSSVISVFSAGGFLADCEIKIISVEFLAMFAIHDLTFSTDKRKTILTDKHWNTHA